MSGLVMGVDGGGTKGHLALFGPSGECAGTAVCGSLNHENMEGAFAELETVLNAFIPAALKNAGTDAAGVAHAVFGLAGVDTAAQHEIISAMLRRMGFADFTLCNDAFLGVAAGCPGGAGICAINGTGSSMAAVDYSGAAVQVGGVGDLSDDRGGSGWYGARAVGAVYNALFKRGRPTALRDMLFAKAGISRKEDYIEVLSGAFSAGSIDMTAFNRLVFEAADAGDAVAEDILEQSAEHYAGGITHLACELDFPPDRALHVTLAGSVFVKERVDMLPRMIERRVRDALGARPVGFLRLEVPPVAGAVLWAARKAGRELETDAVRRGIKTLFA